MRFLGGILGLALLLAPENLNAKPRAGDGDPFPLQCVDFSGIWASDGGTRYTISQTDCKFIRINMLWRNYGEDTVSIVPDNVNRAIPGRDRSAVRHRWNSARVGSILESHLSYSQARKRISEVVMYERANANLLLETTYTTIEHMDGTGLVERGYEQQVFRRIAYAGRGFSRKPAR